MALEDWLVGIGSGLQGAAEGYSWQKEHEQKDRAITSREEMQALKNEIALMIAKLKDEGATARTGMTNTSRETVANIRGRYLIDNTNLAQNAQTLRWNTQSGNARGVAETAAAAETGRNRRADQTNTTSLRNQNLTFDTNKMRDRTARYGIDMRTGVDAFEEMGRRTRGTGRASGPNNYIPPGGATPVTGPQAPQAPAPQAAPPAAPAARPTLPNVAPGATGTANIVSARPSLPAGPGAALAALSQQVDQVTRAYDAARDPDQRAMLEQKMLELKSQITALKGAR